MEPIHQSNRKFSNLLYAVFLIEVDGLTQNVESYNGECCYNNWIVAKLIYNA